jgi:hypothetical protein
VTAVIWGHAAQETGQDEPDLAQETGTGRLPGELGRCRCRRGDSERRREDEGSGSNPAAGYAPDLASGDGSLPRHLPGDGPHLTCLRPQWMLTQDEARQLRLGQSIERLYQEMPAPRRAQLLELIDLKTTRSLSSKP